MQRNTQRYLALNEAPVNTVPLNPIPRVSQGFPGVVNSEAPVHLELTRAPLCPRARLCMYRLPSTVSQGRLGARPRLTISSQSSMLVDRDGDRGAQGDVIVLEV